MKHLPAVFNYTKIASAIALISATSTSYTAFAQDEIEEITITGSFISRPADRPQPITVLDNEALQATQRISVVESIRDLPQITNANTTSNDGIPTNDVNLRGLGSRSTLVLLNGSRMTVDANGRSTVDVNNLAPGIMIERVELLLDGASALYGSDAVAGVMNFITRNNFEGAEFRVEAQVADAQSSVPETNLSGLFGVQGDNSGLVLGVEYVRRSDRMNSQDVFSTERLEHGLTTGLWNPGSYLGTTTPGWHIDPLCNSPEIGATPENEISDPAGYFSGPFCRGLLSLERTFIPESERLTAMAVANYDFGGEYLRGMSLEAGFSNTEQKGSYGTGVPLLALNETNMILPATNPGVIDANARNPAFPIQDYQRVFSRQQSPLLGPLTATSKQWTNRVALTMDGGFGANSDWDWKVTGTYSQNDQWTQLVDTIADRFSRAIQGFGGPNCKWNLVDGTSSNPNIAAGDGGCLYWNPFASSLLAQEGDATWNDPILRDWMTYGDTTLGESNLWSLEAITTGELWDMAGGTTGIALGYQFRKQVVEVEQDPIRKDGGFGFSTQSFTGWTSKRETDALFAEIVMFPLETLEVDIAARYEDTAGQSSTEPKISMLWTPTENLFIRASAGSSFRQPSELQVYGQGGATPPRRAVGGETIQANAIVFGNEALTPEESDNWSLGFTWDITEGLTVEATYWDYKFTNLVAQVSAAAVLEADYQTGFITDPRNQIFPGRPNEVCEITGRWDGVDIGTRPADCITGFDFSLFLVDWANQDQIQTNGIDFTVDYTWEMLNGDFNTRLAGSWVNEYIGVGPDGTLQDAVGTDAFGFSGVTRMPELQANWTLQYFNGNHGARLFVRYVDGTKNTNPDPLAADSGEGSFTQIDVSYNYALPTSNPSKLSFAIVNLADERPPLVDNSLTTVDTTLYDARGRMFRMGYEMSF